MRKGGILMHLSSLASPYGIGTMGQTAYEFVDFLQAAGQSIWQLLPVCPTSYGDSPYQSYCTYAGNPYFIDLDKLAEMGLLEKEDYATIKWCDEPGKVDYGKLYENRYPILRKATKAFLENTPDDFAAFCEENDYWLADFALFMALKDAHGGAQWSEWKEELKNREAEALANAEKEYANDVLFWKVVQYLFFHQWKELKAYANGKGIEIIGDLPIYVSLDSVDVWSHPELFQLDENKVPKEIAGCPPDGFSEVGQIWGNPLYDWDYHEETKYAWWIQRIEYLCKVYDYLRIDHFRGFDSYFAIPYGATTAKIGHWNIGPGMKLFNEVEKTIGKQAIIAEDLGYLTDSVKQLLADSGFPGMKLLEFAFDQRDASGTEYLPHNYIPNCIAYTGTHDNDTIVGWFGDASDEDVAAAREYLCISDYDELHWKMMAAIWQSVADTAIIQAQDLFGLGSETRMNQPSTVGMNWRWRALPGVFTPELAAKLNHKMHIYGRLPE